MVLLVVTNGDALAQKKPKEQLKRVEKKAEPKKHLPTDTVGIVNGDVITYSDYRTILSEIVQSAARDSIVSEADFTKYVDATWDRCVETILVQQAIVKAKIQFTDDEVKAELVNNPPQFIERQFMDSTGTFHPEALHAALYDPSQAKEVGIIVHAQRAHMEMSALMISIAPTAKTPEEQGKAYATWLEAQKSKARMFDNRIRFGYY